MVVINNKIILVGLNLHYFSIEHICLLSRITGSEAFSITRKNASARCDSKCLWRLPKQKKYLFPMRLLNLSAGEGWWRAGLSEWVNVSRRRKLRKARRDRCFFCYPSPERLRLLFDCAKKTRCVIPDRVYFCWTLLEFLYWVEYSPLDMQLRNISNGLYLFTQRESLNSLI